MVQLSRVREEFRVVLVQIRLVTCPVFPCVVGTGSAAWGHMRDALRVDVSGEERWGLEAPHTHTI